MQDGAPPHVTNEVKHFLRQKFGNRIISRGEDDTWPPRSPDLTPCDFFLWGYVKSLVYRQPPQTMPDLMLAIQNAVDSLTPDQLRDAVYNTVARAQAVIDCNGGHIEHLLK